MSFPLLGDIERLEADAARIRVQASVLKIKETAYKCRRDANRAIQLHHASLSVPKHLIGEDNSCGYRVTLRCIEDCCPVTVSIRQFREGGNKCWRVYDRDGIKEEWTHSFFCNKVASIPVGVAADLLKDETARGKDLFLKAKQKGICLGGAQVSSSGVSHVQHVAASRVSRELNKMQRAENNINKLPGVLQAYLKENPGAHAAFVVEDNVFKRCLLVPQLSISMFKHGFLRKLFSIDCGHWRNIDNRDYKLLLIFGSTGNNNNCTLVWAIVDGERKNNILWAFEELKVAGVDLNSSDVATLSDQGSAIVSAIKEALPNSFHLTCAKHWLGNHPRNWGDSNDNIYWKLV